MTESEAMELCLADFFAPDSEDVLVPPARFFQWMKVGRKGREMYEPRLLEGPAARTTLCCDGVPQKVINLASYNYLGLAGHPEVVAASREALERYGTGACGSPVLSGMTDLHRRLESAIAEFLGREDALLFNSGFAGGIGLIAGVLRKGDVAVLDSKCHACLVAGVRLSGATIKFFHHNDPESLDRALYRRAGTRRLVIVEGVYSMDGDWADLPNLLPVVRQHNVQLVIDEAHSILACGPNGRGITEHFGCENDIRLMYGTFSKAFGGIGGFASGPTDLISYLRFFAGSYTFSCALPPAVTAGLIAALNVSRREPELRSRLNDNANYFRDQLHGLGLDTGKSTSQVIPIMLGGERSLLYDLCGEFRRRGLFLAPVDYPAAPENELRLRAAITAGHTREDLDEALSIINDVLVPHLKSIKIHPRIEKPRIDPGIDELDKSA
jgi:glycine C-acetyltransferase